MEFEKYVKFVVSRMSKSPFPGMSICIRAMIFLILIWVLSGCAASTTSFEERKITLVGTSDLQGMLEPYTQKFEINGSEKEMLGGGIARIATLLQQINNENPSSTFVISNGDDLMNRYFHTFKGEAIYSLMSRSGYELYAPGNHEFDKGAETFAGALNSADFEMICSDLLVESTPLEGRCTPYKIVDTKGVRVGFFSLMTEGFPLITMSGKVKVKTSNIETAQKMVKTLQGQGCDIIVALSHTGFKQDSLIAQQVDGIDVIFGGHSHQVEGPAITNDTIIVNGGEKGSYVTRLDIPLDSHRSINRSQVQYSRIPVVEDIKPDSDVAILLESYTKKLPATVVLGKTTVLWDLTTTALRQNESNVADLVNDLMRKKFDVDIVMNNGGAFRGKKIYPPGNITDVMLHEIDEFSNYVFMLEVKGKVIRQILERSGALYGGGGLMQVSGLRYTIDLNKTPQSLQHNSDGTWKINDPGNRISDISVELPDGTFSPLDDQRTYSILSNSFLVNREGNGYFWFKQYGINEKNTYTTFYTVMAESVEQNEVLDPKPLDGRIKIIQK